MICVSGFHSSTNITEKLIQFDMSVGECMVYTQRSFWDQLILNSEHFCEDEWHLV